MNSVCIMKRWIGVALMVSAMLVTAADTASAQESLAGTWISKAKVIRKGKATDITVTRKITFDVAETEDIGELLIETGRFGYERTVRDKILHIEGDFRHESAGGMGKLKLLPDGTERRFGRTVSISHFTRPERDRIHLRLMLLEKTISCSCCLILDSADVTFTRAKNAPAAQRNGARPRLHQQVLVAWDEVIVPLFVRGLRAIQAPAADTIAAKP